MEKNSLVYKISVLAVSCLLLTACGGGGGGNTATDTNSNITISDNSHPTFSRIAVRTSSVYQPVGEITDASPTFQWKAEAGASNYQFGHEDTGTEMRWKSYTVTASEAGCATADICRYTPDDSELAIGDEKVWWVRPDNADGIWQAWSSAYIFTVVDDGIQIPSSKPISPDGSINTVSPTFTWTPGNGASDYQIGMESYTETDWTSYFVSADQANCTTDHCSFTPNPTTLVNGDNKTWWVREKIGGRWHNWSEGSTFSIDTNTVYIPFSGISNISSIVQQSGKWYGISGTEILVDDGANNVTTLLTNELGFASNLSVAIPGKLYFVKVNQLGSTAMNNSFGLGRVEALHVYTIANQTDEMIFSNSDVTINVGSMTDYLLVSHRHKAYGFNDRFEQRKFFKIDSEANQIYLGFENFVFRFSVVSVNHETNEIHLKHYELGQAVKFNKISDAINVGLEIDTSVYAPFENYPDITSVVESGGKWYGILDTEILVDDGASNVTTLYTNALGFKSSLSTSLTGKLFFVTINDLGSTQMDLSFGQGRREELHSITLSTNQDEEILANNKVDITEGSMIDYLLVSERETLWGVSDRQSKRWFYKIDRLSDLIQLGYDNGGVRFLVDSVDKSNNIIHIKHGLGAEIKSKISSLTGIGLQDDDE